MKNVVKEIYGTISKTPKFTLVIVNKRINQRFFVKDGQGYQINPPSGCLVDKLLVEQENQDEYDFYLIPQFTT